MDDAFFDDRGKCDSGVAVVVEMFGDFLDCVGDGVWEGGLRRGNSEALSEKFTVVRIDRSAFDAGAADIDAEDVHWGRDFFPQELGVGDGLGVGVGPGMPRSERYFSRKVTAPDTFRPWPLTCLVRPLLNSALALLKPAKPYSN